MKKDTNISERLLQLIDYLGVNKNSFAKKLGYDRSQVVYDLLNGKAKPSFDFFNKFVGSEYYEHIDTDWLITGKGEMLKSNISIVSEPMPSYGSNEPKVSMYKLKTDYFGTEKQQIPLYEIEASAGLSTLFDTQVQQIPLDFISVPNAPVCDGAVYVRGDSMYPVLKAGDIVCYKTIHSLDNVYYGEMYLLDIDVEGDQYLTFKYVKKSSKGEEFFCLESHNQHHASKDVLKSSVRALAIVKLSIRYNTVS